MNQQGSLRPRVGIIGLGLVGTAIGELLIEKGYSVAGCDIDATKCQYFSQLGGKIFSKQIEMARNVDIIVLSLMTSQIIEDVLSNPEIGCLNLKAGDSVPRPLIINLSTIEPADAEKFARISREKHFEYIDCPISGSSAQIRKGEGILLVGGNKSVVDRFSFFLNDLGRSVLYLGDVGSGSKGKLIVNLVLGLNRAALAEGLLFAELLKIPSDVTLSVLRQSAAYSAVMDTKGDKMIQNDFTPAAYLQQHSKDVDLIRNILQKNNAHLPFTDLHSQILHAAIQHGDGDLDNSAIIRELRRRFKPV
jgi:3-hydroxyisobutyrate dehydrogenase-like beta-hydroxyacid dehydrogenase